MTQLKLRLMGCFEASAAGKPITTFETNKVKALLAYLAAEDGRAHSREVLAGLLWSDFLQASALASLRHALAALRQVTGDRLAQPTYLLISRETVQINHESDIQVDLWDFEQAIGQAEGNHRQSIINSLKSAIELFNGPFLDGLYCDSEPFEEWVQTRREQLNRQVREALIRLATIYRQAGEYEFSILSARRLLELAPWEEAAHRLIMEGLAHLGQRNAALAQYNICCQILKKQLDVEPTPETHRLYETIRSGRAEPPRHSLPASPLPLIGRESELGEIASRLQDPACRLLTLTGPGGIGKTYLALESATRQVDHFQQGIYFVSLAALQSVDAIPPAIAQALGFTFYPGGEPTQELLDYLRKKELLLLLDNFEHLLEGVGLVTAILQAAPQVKILVTSRTRLNLRSEYLFPVEGLDFPEPKYWDLDRYAAVKLFIEGAQRVRPRYQAAAGDYEAIGQICRGVQGMPLAILLAAGWMELLSPVEILKEIENRSLDFLEADWQDAPQRQRSMRAVFEGSFKLLTPREQEIFAGLSVFRGGFTVSTALAVTGVTLPELRTLVDKSLVQHSPSGRYVLHELLRQYAEEALDRSPVLHETAHDQHCACFTAALKGWWQDLQGSRQFAALKELGVELENVLAAWNWMVAHVQVERMGQAVFGIFNSLGYLYGEPSASEKGRLLCQKAAERLAPLVFPASSAFEDGARLLARLWVYQAVFSFGSPDLAGSLLQQSETLLKQAEAAGQDIRSEKALLLWKKGQLSAPSANVEDFRKLFGESLALFRELGDDYQAARVLDIWGWWTLSVGDYSESRQMLKESLFIHRKLDDKLGMDQACTAICETSWQQLDFDENERLLREILSMYQESGSPRLIAIGTGDLGRILVRQGKFAEGYALLAECSATLDQLGAIGASYYYGLFMCEAEEHLGQYEQARTRCQTIQAFFRENSRFHLIGWSLLLLSFSALGMGQYAEARQRLEESLRTYPKNYQTDRGAISALLSCVERALRRPAQAVSSLLEALRIAVERGKDGVMLLALPFAALLLADRGQVERAVEMYALASRYGYVANSSWFQAIAGREIAALAANLPAEVRAAAQARGRVRDLRSTAQELLAELDNPLPS